MTQKPTRIAGVGLGTAEAKSKQLSLAFPYYFGPGLRPFGAALLWFGRLDSVVMPWVSPVPLRVFADTARRAHARRFPIAELFDMVGSSFEESCVAIASEAKELESLGDRVTRIAMVGCGGQLRYQQLRDEYGGAVELGFGLLDNPELMRVACCQFMWRCYEYYLELSESLDAVLDKLSHEEHVEAGKSRLLAECLLNHFSSFSTNPHALVTGAGETIPLLAKVAIGYFKDLEEGTLIEPASIARDRLASNIFENTLSHLCPPISRESGARYRNILDEKGEVLESARRKCYLAADEILGKEASRDTFRLLLEQTLMDLRSEVQEVADIDASSWRSFTGELLEDRILWASVVGFAGGMTGALPPVALAAAGVSLCTSVATKGISEIRNKAKTLKDSDWCFIYELNKRRINYSRKRAS